uniref:Uncharacterized protein n=1 Tax=Peromyscus maniculatus bairdii TaxID=230844 RepID=A0A8C8ULI6_PERMB
LPDFQRRINSNTQASLPFFASPSKAHSHSHSRNQHKQCLENKYPYVQVDVYCIQKNTSHSISSFSHSREWQVERSLEGCSKTHGSECCDRCEAQLMGTRPLEGRAGTRPSHLYTTHLWSG